MTAPRGTRADRRRAAIVLGVFAVAAVLDYARAASSSAPLPRVNEAHVFALIVSGISWLASALSTAATVTVSYLASALSWLAGRVATFISSSGAMFTRIWDGVKVVWSSVLKPALAWLDKTVRALHDWLVKTFGPILKWLEEVRRRVLRIYEKFVRPVLDTIDFIHQVNGVLLTFHIKFLSDVDAVLEQVKRYIDEPFQFVLRQLARVQDWIDRVVDLDGFFQKWTLVASLRKHAPAWMGFFWADQIGPVRGQDGSDERTADYPSRAAAADADALGAYLETGLGDKAATIDELAKMLLAAAEAPPAPAPANV